MTSPDVLIEALLFEANESAKKIIHDSKKTIQTTLEEQRKKGRERSKDIVSSIDRKAHEDSKILISRDLATTEGEAKSLILKKKQVLIDNVLTHVKDELRTWIKTEKYLLFLENIIIEGGITVGTPDLKIILNERDSALPLNLTKLAEKIGEKTGKKTNITKSEQKIDVIGGVIIESISTDDKSKEFYEKNPSLKLINETSTLTRFKIVLKNFIEKQILPNIKDSFILTVLEDLLNNYSKIDSLEERKGKILINSTFEGMLKNSEKEIKYKIAQTLFS